MVTSYYWDGNTEIVQEDGDAISDRAIRLSLSLPVRVSRPLWSFNTSYTISARLYNDREDNDDISQNLSLGALVLAAIVWIVIYLMPPRMALPTSARRTDEPSP